MMPHVKHLVESFSGKSRGEGPKTKFYSFKLISVHITECWMKLGTSKPDQGTEGSYSVFQKICLESEARN